MTERFRLQFRTEMLNALNYPNFSNRSLKNSTASGSEWVGLLCDPLAVLLISRH
jgi:hypothetical protein